MKIIKQGEIKEKKYKYIFECENCGCIFEAEENEVRHLPQLAVAHDWISTKATCPTCGYDVFE